MRGRSRPNSYDNSIARTLGANQTLVHPYITPTGDTSVTINDTAPTTDRYNLSICEILPAPGP